MTGVPTRKRKPDLRRLPSELDPTMLFEYALSRALTEGDGLEWYLSRLMPRSLIRSFAIAIDPFSVYRSRLPSKVTKTNRNRVRSVISVLDLCYEDRVTTVEDRSTIPNWLNRSGKNSPFTVTTVSVNKVRVGPVVAPQSPTRHSSDTTSRTRPMFSEYGEFVSQQPQYFTSPRTNTWSDSSDVRVHVNAAPDNDQVKRVRTYRHAVLGPSASYLPPSNYTSLRNAEKLIAENLIRDHVVSLFSKASPVRKDYTLFRNIVELRDLPRSVVSLRSTAMNLVALRRTLGSGTLDGVLHSFKTSAKDIPNEYLSYMFGWRQLYRDLMDLMQVPDRVTKKVNFLIRRSGRETTFRAMKRLTPPSSGEVSGFAYPNMLGDNTPFVTKSYVTREAELRIACNAKFDFPDVMLPSFQKQVFLKQLGVVPTITDLYNLVPWTWLIDWFTGIGDYLDAIETINSDNRLVNWAVVTCHLASDLRTNFQWRTKDTQSVNWSGDWNVHTSDEQFYTHSHASTLKLQTRVRRDVLTSMSGVRTTADLSSLTAYQQSILGALLAQRAGKPSRHP